MFFVGVSTNNIIKVLTLYEDESLNRDGKNGEKLVDVKLGLKGIMNLTIVNNRYLVIETFTQLLSYYIWDICDPKSNSGLEPQHEVLFDEVYKDFSCLVQPCFSFLNKDRHPTSFAYSYNDKLQLFECHRK